MGRVPITLMGYRCERCSHEWLPRADGDDQPKVCPKCKSPYWNRPRRGAATTYEEFRDRIREVLTKSDHGLTWTEVRTQAQLSQAFPNNQWVHRLENDIRLKRARDNHGIIRWQLA